MITTLSRNLRRKNISKNKQKIKRYSNHPFCRNFRHLVIEMVLATDMSCHFTQLKTMKSLLSLPEKYDQSNWRYIVRGFFFYVVFSVEKTKALALVLHCADISHPGKPWTIHQTWTQFLMEEFFKQGEKEKELGLPCSPLCDRDNTLVAESQIGKKWNAIYIFFLHYYFFVYWRFYSIYCWTIIYRHGRYVRKSSSISQCFRIWASITISPSEEWWLISDTFCAVIEWITSCYKRRHTRVNQHNKTSNIIKVLIILVLNVNYQHLWQHLSIEQQQFEDLGQNFSKQIVNDGCEKQVNYARERKKTKKKSHTWNLFF